MNKINFSINYRNQDHKMPFVQGLADQLKLSGHNCQLNNEELWNKEDSKIDAAIYLGGPHFPQPKPWHLNILIAGSAQSPSPYDHVLVSDLKDSVTLASEVITIFQEMHTKVSTRTTSTRAMLTDHEFRTHGPTVSVLMATHNRRKLLKRALKSILSQSYENLEICLVRDGGEAVDDVVAELNDSRIKLTSYEQNRGKGAALNKAFETSKGEYIAYLDDDDVWYENHIERLMVAVRLLNQDFVYSNGIEVLLESKTDPKEISRTLRYARQVELKELLEFNYITGINVLHERSLFTKAGGFDSSLKVLIDFDMWRRLACLAKPHHVNYTTAEYYLHRSKGSHITDLAAEKPLEYRKQRIKILSKNIHLSDPDLKSELQKVRRRAQFDYAVFSCTNALDQNDLQQASRSLMQAQKYYTRLYSAQLMYAVCLLRTAKPKEALSVFKDCINSNSDTASLLMACSVGIMLKDNFAGEVLEILAGRTKQMTKEQLEILNDYKERYSSSIKK
ncbi:glycosyltransferase family 2 protein [Maridesulfovibrio sp.]|uniref:glycosyltransferase family 2 protein n=1 Tax=Maridesulfovibrio sp. TaxID=2795000 RepID=UPI0039F0758B